MIRAFVTTLAWHVAGREFPTAVPRILEVMFDRRFHGVSLGYGVGDSHPFAEPIRKSTVAARGRDTPEDSRRRVCKALSESLMRFRVWAANEQYFFSELV